MLFTGYINLRVKLLIQKLKKIKLYLLWFWMKRCTSRKICNTDMQTLWSRSVRSNIYLLSQRVEYGWLEVVLTLHIETIWVLCWSKLHLHTNLITLSQKKPSSNLIKTLNCLSFCSAININILVLFQMRQSFHLAKH